MSREERKKEEIVCESSNDLFSAILTSGKIELWFGRKAEKNLVRDVILALTGVDRGLTHEFCVDCDFDTISSCESRGLNLISYSKRGDGYRAFFSISLSSTDAVEYLVDRIVNGLRDSSQTCKLLWSGTKEKINMVIDELRKIDRDLKVERR